MSGETRVTVVGNLTADPELRFTASGAPVADFTVAATPRTFDRAAGEWKDGDPLFLRCSLWRQSAENAATSLTKGARVIVEVVLAADVRDEGRREAHRRRTRRRRDRCLAALRHRPDQPGHQRRQPRPG